MMVINDPDKGFMLVCADCADELNLSASGSDGDQFRLALDTDGPAGPLFEEASQ